MNRLEFLPAPNSNASEDMVIYMVISWHRRSELTVTVQMPFSMATWGCEDLSS